MLEPDAGVGCGSEWSRSRTCTGNTCPFSPPDKGSGHFLLRSRPKLLEDAAKENLPGRLRAFQLCLTPWGTCVMWGDPISSPKTSAPACQGTWGCPWPSPGCPGCPHSPTLPCFPRLP